MYRFRNPALASLAAIAARHGVIMKAKLRAFVDSLDDVEEAHREFYVEDTDTKGKKRFKLDADGLEDVTGLKSTITALRNEIKNDYKPKIEALGELVEGEDLAEVITAGRAALEAKKSGKPNAEVESVKNQMTTAHAKEVGKLKSENAAMFATLEETLVDLQATKLIGDNGNPKLILPVIRGESMVVPVEDAATGKAKYVVQIKGADGKPRVDKDGNTITLEARLAELRQDADYSDAWYDTGASGSGAPREGERGTPHSPRTPAAPTDTAAKDAKRSSVDYGAI